MVLHPCNHCRRHIDRHAEVCPFCAAVPEAVAPRAMLAGRLSRAMLFASATLVSCDQGAKPNAESGSGSAAIKAPSTTWKLRGVVKDSQGRPLGGASIHLVLEGQPTQPAASFNAVADAQGRYQVEGATAGRYNVSFSWSDSSASSYRGNAYTSEMLTLVIGSDQSLNATMDPSVPAMPYGAPPARRRVV